MIFALMQGMRGENLRLPGGSVEAKNLKGLFRLLRGSVS